MSAPIAVFSSKYGVARNIFLVIPLPTSDDHAVGATWTPAAGDVKISKNGGAAANVANLPTAIAMGNSALWHFDVTATEMEAAQVHVTIADSAAKAVGDTAFMIETYGHANAQHAVDLDDAVRAGLTALPNAAAEAAGGLYTRGTGAGQIRQVANGLIDANTMRWLDTAAATPTVAGVPEVDLTYLDGDANAAVRLKHAAMTMHFATASGTPTTTVIAFSDLPGGLNTNALVGNVVAFTGNTTAGLRGERRTITASTATSITVSPALTTAPAVGDIVVIL